MLAVLATAAGDPTFSLLLPLRRVKSDSCLVGPSDSSRPTIKRKYDSLFEARVRFAGGIGIACEHRRRDCSADVFTATV